MDGGRGRGRGRGRARGRGGRGGRARAARARGSDGAQGDEVGAWVEAGGAPTEEMYYRGPGPGPEPEPEAAEWHTPGGVRRSWAAAAGGAAEPKPCRFGAACTRPDCWFAHPGREQPRFSLLTWNLQAAGTRVAGRSADRSGAEACVEQILRDPGLRVPGAGQPADVLSLQELQRCSRQVKQGDCHHCARGPGACRRRAAGGRAADCRRRAAAARRPARLAHRAHDRGHAGARACAVGGQHGHDADDDDEQHDAAAERAGALHSLPSWSVGRLRSFLPRKNEPAR